MKTPFGPPLDIEKLNTYLESHNPLQMSDDIVNWNCDATDLLTLADLFNFKLSKPEYSVVLYDIGLRLINLKPSLVSSDTNIQGAYAAFGSVLIKLKM